MAPSCAVLSVPSQQQQPRIRELMQAVFGRQLDEHEQLVFAALMMAVSSTTGSGTGTVTAGAQTAPPPVTSVRAVPAP